MDKNQIINEIKSYQLIEVKRMINNDGKIIYNIILGELMARKSKLDIILEKLDKLEVDVSILKQDMCILKKEATKHGWDLSN